MRSLITIVLSTLLLTGPSVSYAAVQCPCVEAKKAGKAASRLKAIGKAIKALKARVGAKKPNLRLAKASAIKCKDAGRRVKVVLEKVKKCAGDARSAGIGVTRGKIHKKDRALAANLKQLLAAAREELREAEVAEEVALEEMDANLISSYRDAEIDLAIQEEPYPEPAPVMDFVTDDEEDARVAAAEAAIENSERDIEAFEAVDDEVADDGNFGGIVENFGANDEAEVAAVEACEMEAMAAEEQLMDFEAE